MKLSIDEMTSLQKENLGHALPAPLQRSVGPLLQRGLGLIDTTRACADLFVRLQAEGLLSPFRMGGDVLDCGTGIVALSLALTNVRVCINGMDINPTYSAAVAGRHTHRGVNVQMSHRDILHLPFAKAQFDLVVSTSRWILAREQGATLTELCRVLRPGAPLIILVKDSDALFPAQSDWLTPEQVIDTMQQMGLHNVQASLLSDNALESQVDVACIGMTPQV